MNALHFDRIKRRAVIAMVSHDVLTTTLALKGGNALSLAYGISSRPSFDLDFSMEGDFESVTWLSEVVPRLLAESFVEVGILAFDVKVLRRPPQVSDSLKDFWGGYRIEFKLIDRELARGHESNIEWLRRHAFALGPRGAKVFPIDISCHECCDRVREIDFEKYTIRVYSPELILCEKLRAICQQHPDYGSVVKRRRAGAPRPRDFYDIFSIQRRLHVDATTEDCIQLLDAVFARKNVPLSLLSRIIEMREFHRQGFAAVEATVSQEEELKDFDFYFDNVLAICQRLEALRNVQPP